VIVAGLRADFHNLAGTIITPRLNVRYRFENPDLTLRAAIGRGYRMSNIFADNISLFASNRILEVDGPLKIEDAWNTGLNGIYKFKVFGREGSVNVDLYRTWFNNQVILDLDSEPSKIMVYNLDGRSYSNSLMTMFQYEVLKGLEVKLAYKTNDVRTTYRNAGLRALPLIPRQRGLVALSYETPNEKWRINASSQIVGPQRLADLPANLPQEYHAHQIHGETPVYALVNAQLTRVIAKHFEVYAGGENLTNYRQDHAILAYDDPFGQFFDATRIYAPMMGRRIYIGLRWGIE
jgi:outer membrane receptor protein involved in Fe transport